MLRNLRTKLAVSVALSLSAGIAQAAQIAINGGFEAGNFGGWAQYPSGGTSQTIITTNPSSGRYAANVNISVGAGGVNNVLKQERLLDGTGLLSEGDIISYSFDYRGSAADGGVLFLENFCETAAGPLCGQDLTRVDLLPISQDTWNSYSGTFTLGADVSAYTFQLAAVCGASATCTADYYFDNISITADVSAVPVPAAVWLFGSGLIGLVGMARRKKAI